VAYGPLQSNFTIPANFQDLAVYLDSIRKLVQRAEAISLGYQRLAISWLNLQAFIQIFKGIVVSMKFRQYFRP
jgi:hypothetical protein